MTRRLHFVASELRSVLARRSKVTLAIVGIVLLVHVSFANAGDLRSRCTAPTQSDKKRVALYAARRFHVDPDSVHIESDAKVEGSCFWRLDLTSSGDQVLTLYLSPDRHFAAPDLYDTRVDPLKIVKADRQKVIDILAAQDGARRGGARRSISIVEFSDFQCPFCKALSESLAALQALPEYKDVNVVFRNFPIATHSWATEAAVTGECLRKVNVDQFWQFHDAIFRRQAQIEANTLKEATKEFGGCEDSEGEKAKSRVDGDVKMGVAVGVRVTPTFFVNGAKYEGSHNLKSLREIVDQARREVDDSPHQ